MDTISVVIPAYNRPSQLCRALRSVASQTRLPLEVIVCDDGSEPELKSVVVPFQRTMDVKYLRIANSGGPARPRNVATQVAAGTWVSFLDCDDWWIRTRLEQVGHELNGSCDLLYHKLRIVHSTRRIGGGWNGSVGCGMRLEAFEHLTCVGNAIPTSSVVARRSVLLDAGGFNEEPSFHAVEDFELWIRIAKARGRFEFLNKVLGWYSAEVGISKSSLTQMERHRLVLHSFLADATESQRAAIAARIAYVDATHLFAARQPAEALRSLRAAAGLLSRSQRVKRWLKIGRAGIAAALATQASIHQ